MAHSIRLRGPWQAVAPGHERKVQFPCTLASVGWPEVTGPVLFYRRFGRPSNLEASEEVWLLSQSLPGLQRVLLNGREITSIDNCLKADVTDLLLPRNELKLVFEITHSEQGPSGEIWLEIGQTGSKD